MFQELSHTQQPGFQAHPPFALSGTTLPQIPLPSGHATYYSTPSSNDRRANPVVTSNINLPSSSNIQSIDLNRRHERDDAEEDGDGDLYEQPRKKSKTDPTLIIQGYGNHYGFMGDLFRDIGYTINHGIKRDAQVSSVYFDERRNKHYRLYKYLLKIIPDLKSRIAAGGEESAMDIAIKLSQGRQKLIQNIVSGVKNAIHDWQAFTPSLVKGQKERRGFKHDECGRLLCPIDLDWNNESVRQGLRDFKFDRYPIDADHLPRLLWPGDDLEFDRTDLVRTFGRNQLILQAAAHVLRGPCAALALRKSDENTSVSSSRAANTKPRASAWGLTCITPACIAASAVLVRFALDDERTFSAAAKPKGFSYRRFYHKVVHYIEQTMPERHRTDLLDWYTRAVLGCPFSESDDSDSDAGGNQAPEDRQPSAMDWLIAQSNEVRNEGTTPTTAV